MKPIVRILSGSTFKALWAIFWLYLFFISGIDRAAGLNSSIHPPLAPFRNLYTIQNSTHVFLLILLWVLIGLPKSSQSTERPEWIHLFTTPLTLLPGAAFSIVVARTINFAGMRSLQVWKIEAFSKWLEIAPFSANLTIVYRWLMLVGFGFSIFLLIRRNFVVSNPVQTRLKWAFLFSAFVPDPGLVWIPSKLIWPMLKWSVQSLVVLTLRLVFNPQDVVSSVLPESGLLIISTPHFRVNIGGYCSGVEGLSFFILSAAVLFFLDRKKIDRYRGAQFLIVGCLLMYVMNIFRISSLIYVGERFDPKFALEFWHIYAGAVFYTLAIWIYFSLFYRKLLSDAQPRNARRDADLVTGPN